VDDHGIILLVQYIDKKVFLVTTTFNTGTIKLFWRLFLLFFQPKKYARALNIKIYLQTVTRLIITILNGGERD